MVHNNSFHPDLWYYYSFLCFRIIHLCCTLIFHFTIMRDMERMAGWLRMGIIYIFSGIGGYLYSGILLPYQAEVIVFVRWIVFLFCALCVNSIIHRFCFAEYSPLKKREGNWGE